MVRAGSAGPAHNPTNRALVTACLQGDEDAWQLLIARYRRLIFSIPIKHGLTRDDAADIFQAVCLDLVAELSRLREPDALPKWLIQATAHKCARYRRQQQRIVSDEAGPDAVVPDAALPESLLVEVERDQAVRDAVEALSPRCRSLVEMLFFETPARPYRDVASRLGLALGSIGFMRHRCLEKLRTALQGAGL
jgi:RNA polymerase sigma factor (sigma-70 family)